MTASERITILGATGSIGRQTLAVIQHHPDCFAVFALTANQNDALLFKQCQIFQPRYAALADPEAAQRLSQAVKKAGLSTEVLSGAGELETLCTHEDVQTVVSGIVGAAGLPATMAAIRAGKRVLLANKEALVMAGALVQRYVKDSGAVLLPVDSEHNALMQCLPIDFTYGSAAERGVESVTLTASGGPFRTHPLEALEAVTVEQALQHPNWSMGDKITVDSATMMNKGLEVIEAYWLFGLPETSIQAVIHPQSAVHAFVHYKDGSVIAELGVPDMRTPIAAALSWPERIATPVKRLDLVELASLTFEPMCTKRYPCYYLAREALKVGGIAPCVLNAANEVAVAAFLAGRIGFRDIARRVEKALSATISGDSESLEALYAVDQETRRIVSSCL